MDKKFIILMMVLLLSINLVHSAKVQAVCKLPYGINIISKDVYSINQEIPFTVIVNPASGQKDGIIVNAKLLSDLCTGNSICYEASGTYTNPDGNATISFPGQSKGGVYTIKVTVGSEGIVVQKNFTIQKTLEIQLTGEPLQHNDKTISITWKVIESGTTNEVTPDSLPVTAKMKVTGELITTQTSGNSITFDTDKTGECNITVKAIKSGYVGDTESKIVQIDNPLKKITVEIDNIQFPSISGSKITAGDNKNIEVKVVDEEGNPIDVDKVTATFTDPNTVKQVITLQESTIGIFYGTVNIDKAFGGQEYSVKIEAQKFGEPVIQPLTFSVAVQGENPNPIPVWVYYIIGIAFGVIVVMIVISLLFKKPVSVSPSPL